MIQSNSQISSQYNNSLKNNKFFGKNYFKSSTRMSTSSVNILTPFDKKGHQQLRTRDNKKFLVYLGVMLGTVLLLSCCF